MKLDRILRFAALSTITCLFLLAAAHPVLAAEYRSASDGDYNDASTWEVKDGDGNWQAAATPPGDNDDVTIQEGHTVTLPQGDEAHANDLVVNGQLTGAGEGTDVVVCVKGKVTVGPNGSVTSQPGHDADSGDVTIKADGDVVVFGDVSTGDADGSEPDGSGADSGGVDIKSGGRVYKKPASSISTGDAGDGRAPGNDTDAGAGGNSGGVKIEGKATEGGGAENGENHHVETGEPGAAGDGDPANGGTKGKIEEKGDIIVLMGTSFDGFPSRLAGGQLALVGGAMISFSGFQDFSGEFQGDIVISAPGGVVEFSGCGPNSFVSFGGQVYIDAAEIVTLDLPLEAMFEPDPILGGPVGVGESRAPAAVSIMALKAAPNPFNPRTVVSFELARSSRVEIQIFDARGRNVMSFAPRRLEAGEHRVEWDGRTGSGLPAASGAYFARIATAGETRQIKLTMLK